MVIYYIYIVHNHCGSSHNILIEVESPQLPRSESHMCMIFVLIFVNVLYDAAIQAYNFRIGLPTIPEWLE